MYKVYHRKPGAKNAEVRNFKKPNEAQEHAEQCLLAGGNVVVTSIREAVIFDNSKGGKK
ncbi:hypothetical protein [Gibbsiella quercinecans]|uniref:hypothetical protein n=1 Tax=Gibbsiella quercinecans TaxID=929813 RepID=UPI002430EC83|nr:hypothetical protein [Gibbsiella quercinecans]